jgi:hypothetical protein
MVGEVTDLWEWLRGQRRLAVAPRSGGAGAVPGRSLMRALHDDNA